MQARDKHSSERPPSESRRIGRTHARKKYTNYAGLLTERNSNRACLYGTDTVVAFYVFWNGRRGQLAADSELHLPLPQVRRKCCEWEFQLDAVDRSRPIGASQSQGQLGAVRGQGDSRCEAAEAEDRSQSQEKPRARIMCT